MTGVAVVVTAVTTAATLVLPKRYTAGAALLVDTRSSDALGRASDRQATSQTLVATQSDLVASERVARAVVRSLKLADDPQAQADWREATEGRGDPVSFAARALLRRLDVRPNRDSSIIDIAYTGGNAAAAAAIANAFARETVAANLELKVEPARQYAGWFDERSAALRGKLEAAQARLSAFQRERGLIATGSQGQIDIETAKLSQLTQQLLDIQALRAETQSRRVQATRNAGTSPDVAASPAIAALRVDVGKNEAYVEQLRTTLGDSNPQVIAARGQLATLRAQLDAEMRAAAKTVTSGDEVNQRREESLRAATAVQRDRVLALSAGTNELAVLQRDVENTQKALDQVAALQAQTALESQMQQTNVYFLTAATEPPLPSSPKVLVNVGAAAALGLLLGLGAALGLEVRRPMVRDVDDLAAALDLPVIGAVGAARLSAPKAGSSPLRLSGGGAA